MITLKQIIEEHREKYRDKLIWICGLISTDGSLSVSNNSSMSIYIIHSQEIEWIKQVKRILDKETLFEAKIVTMKIEKSFGKAQSPRTMYKLRMYNARYFTWLIIDGIGRKYMMSRKYMILEKWYYESQARMYTPLEDEFLLTNSNEKVIKLANSLKRDKTGIYRRKNFLGLV